MTPVDTARRIERLENEQRAVRRRLTVLGLAFVGLVAVTPLAMRAGVLTLPNTFVNGQVANATQVNANFTAVKTAVDDNDTRITAAVPVGTVISSLIAPDATADFMQGSTTWAFADGTLPASASSYTGAFPDMRGQFLRGMNGTRSDARKDPDTRAVGSQQVDAFQGHRHSMPEAWGFTGSGSNTAPTAAARASVSSTNDPISDGVNGTPRLASETRPGNIAVYWYVKVL